MTAEVLDVEYTVVKTNPMEGETRTPEFLAINPQHSIPTMVDGRSNGNMLKSGNRFDSCRFIPRH